ncbi:DNA-repair protein rad13 [Peziza echinospora]|nr:DNA-repair protein rad13 [Peziza echinospora]
MGVQGLWTILSPCARPVKLETLAQKRLAVDASIWIYQFLKAVRDQEGNALRNSHIVGFFRRICKLLFFGIKPVFVFDGGAPVLKRQTIAGRKSRREGRREDAIKTAGRLLAMQMRRRVEEERESRKREREQRKKDEAEGWQNVEITTGPAHTTTTTARHPNEPEEEPMPENPVYVEELTMTAAQRKQSRTFKKQDPYHLPDLDMSIEHMGAPNDPRVMSPEELAQYAAQFRENGDDDSNVNLYDFSKIDFSSPFFLSLPINDQYAILSAARLRSRLRMGLSKDQLSTMFPNRLDFSKFQIERVRERNELTQRLMNLNGMNAGGDTYEAIYGSGRVAGEKGREYVLVKNDGVEGGWVLGVVGRKEGVVAPRGPGGKKHVDKVVPGESINQPIVLDASQKSRAVVIGGGDSDDDGEEDEDEFEDVPIEGLNRIPKLPVPRVRPDGDREEVDLVELERQQLRQALYNSRHEKSGYQRHPPQQQKKKDDDHGDSLFFGGGEDEVMQDVEVDELFSPTRDEMDNVEQIDEDMHDDDEDMRRAIANSMNQEVGMESDDENLKRAIELSKQDSPSSQREKEKGKGKGKHVVFALSDDEDYEEMDLQAAMRESRRKQSNAQAGGKIGEGSGRGSSATSKPTPAKLPFNLENNNNNNNPFGGLLPFESIPLDFGNSILGRKKKDASKLPPPPPPQPSEQQQQQPQQKERQENNRVLIEEDPYDSGDEGGGFVKDADESAAQKSLEETTPKNSLPLPPWFARTADIRKELENEEKAIEIERERAEEIQDRQQRESSVVVLSSDDEKEDDSDIEMLDVLPEKLRKEKEVVEKRKEGVVRMDDLADVVRAVPPVIGAEGNGDAAKEKEQEGGALEEAEKEDERVEGKLEAAGGEVVGQINPEPTAQPSSNKESEAKDKPKTPNDKPTETTTNGKPQDALPDIPEKLTDAEMEKLAEEADKAIEEDYSDPEDVETLNQLHIEAEEHTRFASSLKQNNGIQKSTTAAAASAPMQTAEEFERELKALRLQQKADRRDADEVTHTMISECQQLLTLFGLPFITAPMEAEAQCAELVHLGLVDGIVTDDSDCFLFGGTRVYKNMFNQAKFVECYLLHDLEKEFALDRNRLIALAHLLGSDYTEGLPGIGPVLALELLTEFAEPPSPSEEDHDDSSPSSPLRRFRDWWTKVQASGGLTYDSQHDSVFRKKLRKAQAAKLFLPDSFPMAEVDEAYLRPQVDDDPSRFEWGVPDMDGIRLFLMETIGWSQERADEVLVPVVRDMNRRIAEGTQSNITRYFEGAVGAGAFAPRKRDVGKSKRMDRARERLHEIATRRASGGVAVAGTGERNGDGVSEGEDDGVTEMRGPPISLRDSAAELPAVSNRGGVTGAGAGRGSKPSRGTNRKATNAGKTTTTTTTPTAGRKTTTTKKKKKAVESASSSSSSSSVSPVNSDGEGGGDGDQEVVVIDSDEHENVGTGGGGSGGRKRKAANPRGAAKRGRGGGRGGGRKNAV